MTAQNKNHFKYKGLSTYEGNQLQPLISGLIHYPSLTLLYGKSGSMKSLLTLYISACIATGKPVFNQHVTTQQNVFYLDGELSEASINTRAHLLEIADIPAQQLTYFQTANDEEFTLSDPETRSDLTQFLLTANFKVLVIDNVRTCFNLVDENNADSWREINSFMKKLRTLGISVILIHHSGKTGDYAGSSNATTVVDYVIGINTNDVIARTLLVTKDREDYGLQRKLNNQSLLFDDMGATFHCGDIFAETPQQKLKHIEFRLSTNEYSTKAQLADDLCDAGLLSRNANNRTYEKIAELFKVYGNNSDYVNPEAIRSQISK